jgi:rhodanese-related sulfurtransferase
MRGFGVIKTFTGVTGKKIERSIFALKIIYMINTIKNIFGFGTKTDFSQLVKDGAIILDVRSKGEFAGGHIKGSVNIPVDQLGSNLDKLTDKNKPIITCCASGMRSASAKSILTSKGFLHVYNGGGWSGLQSKL